MFSYTNISQLIILLFFFDELHWFRFLSAVYENSCYSTSLPAFRVVSAVNHSGLYTMDICVFSEIYVISSKLQNFWMYTLENISHRHVPYSHADTEHFRHSRKFSHTPLLTESVFWENCFDFYRYKFVLPVLELHVNGLITVCTPLCQNSFAQHNNVFCSLSKLLVLSVA